MVRIKGLHSTGSVHDRLVESEKYVTLARATTTDYFAIHALRSLVHFFPQCDFSSGCFSYVCHVHRRKRAPSLPVDTSWIDQGTFLGNLITFVEIYITSTFSIWVKKKKPVMLKSEFETGTIARKTWSACPR